VLCVFIVLNPHWDCTIFMKNVSDFPHRGPWTLTVEAWRLKMEPWRVCRPVVADSHHFDEEQDPDPH
jgi:hypothetical protein